MHKYTYLFMFTLVNFWSISIHEGNTGVPKILRPFINGSAHHTDHHVSELRTSRFFWGRGYFFFKNFNFFAFVSEVNLKYLRFRLRLNLSVIGRMAFHRLLVTKLPFSRFADIKITIILYYEYRIIGIWVRNTLRYFNIWLICIRFSDWRFQFQKWQWFCILYFYKYFYWCLQKTLKKENQILIDHQTTKIFWLNQNRKNLLMFLHKDSIKCHLCNEDTTYNWWV